MEQQHTTIAISLVTTVSLTSEPCNNSEPLAVPPLYGSEHEAITNANDNANNNNNLPSQHSGQSPPILASLQTQQSSPQSSFSRNTLDNHVNVLQHTGPTPLRSHSAVSSMAARGARSRKIVEKVIEKEEGRRYADRFNSVSSTPDPNRVKSPVAGWRRRTSITSGSGAASVWSDESGGSSSKASGAGAKKFTNKIASLAPGEDDRFVAKGRQTIAPRGRGGGVPMKAVEAAQDRARMHSVKAGRLAASSMGMRPASTSTENSGTLSTLRPWATTKVWSGGVSAPKSYKGFEHVRLQMLPSLIFTMNLTRLPG